MFRIMKSFSFKFLYQPKDFLYTGNMAGKKSKNKKVKIDIPIMKQIYKRGCGVGAMAMVYKYFGKNVSQADIVKEIGDLNRGSFTTDHALMALKLGFKVICHSYNLEYFEPGFAKISRANFIRKTTVLIRKEKRAYNRRELKSILEVLKSKIEFKIAMPSLDVIRRFLDKKLPVAIAVNSTVLFEEKFRNLTIGHFIILTGYEKDKFYYNDPRLEKKKVISADKLIFALSNNVFDSSAYMLVIHK